MDNFKYSLKTHQFGKKRYQIFPKQAQKQSISLQVHDPENTVSHLLQPNKSIQHSRNTQFYKQSYNLKQPQFIDQQRKTLKFTKSKTTHSQSSQHLQTSSHIKKIKHITHNINTKSKINIQPQHMTNSYEYRQNTQQFRQQLQVLKYVLYDNQEKLRNLVDSINLLYRNTIQLYQNHQKKLRQLVNKRCYQIASLFKTAVLEIKSKEQNINQLDDRVNILINTVKDSKESLRISKIKQQCIQALQKQQQMIIQKLKKNEETTAKKIQQPSISDKLYLKNIQNQTSLEIQQFIPKSAKDKELTNQMLEFSYFSQKNIQNNFKQIYKQVGSKQFMMISCSDLNLSPATSFLQSPSLQTMNINSIDKKKSPFQANELFEISHTLPLNISKPYSNTDQKQIQYSFRKPILNPKQLKKPISNSISNQQYQNYQNNSLYEYKNPQKKAQIGQNRNYQKLRNNLKILLQTFPNNQIWIDKLNCLRRSNGTYLLDKEGNAFICAKNDYQRLIKQGIISQPKQ